MRHAGLGAWRTGSGSAAQPSWRQERSATIMVGENPKSVYVLDAATFNLSFGPTLAPAIAATLNLSDGRGGGVSHAGAIAGGVAGAVVLVGVIIALVSLCLLRARSWPSSNSDTASSDPSAQVDWVKGPDMHSLGGALTAVAEAHRARQFAFEELEQATMKFSNSMLIGEGAFGQVYKGLLEDGTIVVKRRPGAASHVFSTEAKTLSHVSHRHLVRLLGYCQENDQQMLVYDYVANGSVCNHLYDSKGNALGKLDFKQRLAIALGAAKGLAHLHGRVPPLVHKDFKSSNILLDENLIAKVTDYGLSKLIANGPETSSTVIGKVSGFLDPECYSNQKKMSEKSDVYSFGVFLLELISGREAVDTLNRPKPEWNLVDWGRALLHAKNLGALVDTTLGDNFTEDPMRRILGLGFSCVEYFGDRRPTMFEIVRELEQILEKERGPHPEGTTTVTLGSELFS